MNLDDAKNIGENILESVKDIGGKAIDTSVQALNNAKNSAQKLLIENEIKQSKIKLGDMIYQLNVDTGIKEIEDLKKLIKDSLDEIKYLETKKSK